MESSFSILKPLFLALRAFLQASLSLTFCIKHDDASKLKTNMHFVTDPTC